MGKEGPMVHTGACIASLLGQGGSHKYHLTCTWLRYFKNDRDRRDMITCGAAAGVAAAFLLFYFTDLPFCNPTSRPTCYTSSPPTPVLAPLSKTSTMPSPTPNGTPNTTNQFVISIIFSNTGWAPSINSPSNEPKPN